MQMLLVAFSRRMCCSRVCSASRYAGCAVGVPGDADQPAGQLPLQPGPDRHEAGVRAAEAERHAEALRRADHHVRAPLARRAEQGQREQVGGHRDDRAAAVRLRHRGECARGRGPPRTHPGTAAAGR